MGLNWWKIAMPAPTPAQAGRFYYHGTGEEAAAQAILKEGIQPPPPSKRQNLTTPVAGKVYLSPDVHYALIYAIGGDMAGHELPPNWIIKKGRYGYIFQVNGADLVDIQPDEDSIGQMLWDGTAPPWLKGMAGRVVAPSRLQEVMDGTYAYFASVGKQLLRQMTPWQKGDILDRGSHVAHTGAIKPSAAWRIDKTLCPRLAEDGSNFFELAEKIL